MRRRVTQLLAVGPYVFVALSFVVSRLVYRLSFGVRFDATPVGFYIQYIDPFFMREDLWRSLLYLHHQAPLQNLLVALPLRHLPADQAFAVLDAIYVALGLATALGLVHLMLRLRASPLLASLGTVLYTLNPTTVLYETWLFYHLPVTCILLWSVIALWAFYQSGRARHGVACFGLIALAALFRSTLGPLFLGVLLALLVWLPPPWLPRVRSARLGVLRCAALPLLVLALNSVKPQLVLGYGYGEAMAWGNLVTKVYTELPPAEQRRLQREHLVSPAVGLFCLTDLAEFGTLRIPLTPTGVPLLDMERAPNRRWNAHALEYLWLTQRYYKPDALYLLKHYPEAYLHNVLRAVSAYAAAGTTDLMLPGTANYALLRPLFEPIDAQLGRAPDGRLLALAIALPLVAAFGFWRLLHREPHPRATRRERVVLTYMLLTIAYVTAVTTGVSFGDWSRYRYDIDPLYLTLGVLMLSDGARALRRVWQSVRPLPDAAS
ncbi:MAG: hypothetical protein ABW321_07275 [Polyangiales bacterium]